MRMKDGMKKADQAKIYKHVFAYLAEQGAIGDGPGVQLLATRGGSLRVTMHDPESWNYAHVFCVFSDPALAAMARAGSTNPLNRYSGKWNFLFDNKWTPEEAFAHFQRALEPLLFTNAAKIKGVVVGVTRIADKRAIEIAFDGDPEFEQGETVEVLGGKA